MASRVAWKWIALAMTAALVGLIAGVVLTKSDHGPTESLAIRNAAGTGVTPADLAAKGLSDRLAAWLTQPGCDRPSFSISPSDFESEGNALKAGLKNAWNILKTKCSASSPGFPDFLYSIPAGTILRDANSGHAFLVTLQGWKSIPTGGDYLCFVGQGDPVIDLPGLDSVTMGFSAGDAICTSATGPGLSVDPNGGAGTLGQGASPQGPTVNPQRAASRPPSSPPATSPPATAPPSTSPPATSPPSTSPPTTSPPTTSPPTTSPPPASKGFHVEDDYYGGTWARYDPNDGTWYDHNHQPPNGKYWFQNGLGIGVDCARSAAAYRVKNNGQDQTWTWWLHVTDDTWIPAAAVTESTADGPQGVAVC